MVIIIYLIEVFQRFQSLTPQVPQSQSEYLFTFFTLWVTIASFGVFQGYVATICLFQAFNWVQRILAVVGYLFDCRLPRCRLSHLNREPVNLRFSTLLWQHAFWLFHSGIKWLLSLFQTIMYFLFYNLSPGVKSKTLDFRFMGFMRGFPITFSDLINSTLPGYMLAIHCCTCY